MNQLVSPLPAAAKNPIDYAQRRYRWVGPRGRYWYQLILLAMAKRHNLNQNFSLFQ
jgi:hypothetical protein